MEETVVSLEVLGGHFSLLQQEALEDIELQMGDHRYQPNASLRIWQQVNGLG